MLKEGCTTSRHKLIGYQQKSSHALEPNDAEVRQQRTYMFLRGLQITRFVPAVDQIKQVLQHASDIRISISENFGED